VGKTTLADLRKRAPNLPEAELRKNMRIIRRLEEFQHEAERRAKSPKAKRAAELEWRRHVESVLLGTKNGYDGGDENGMWYALLFCLQTKTPIPAPWPAEALERFALERIKAKKRRGRPNVWLS
jgi:hypothetical protein